jgi:hypothetical protein
MSDDEEYDLNAYELLFQQNEELELMLQNQAEMIEKLQQEIERLKIAQKNRTKELKEVKKAGQRMYQFIEEGINADLFHDEVLDSANLAQEKWYDIVPQ